MTAAVIRHVTGAKATTARSVVQRMYDEASGDLNRATDMVANYVANFPRLTEELVRYAARGMLNEIGQAKRYQIASVSTPADRGMSPAEKAAQRRAIASGAIILETLYDMPYKVNGIDTPLGNMTGAEVEVEAQRFLSQGTKMVREGRWLLAVAAKAGERKVRDAVKIRELHRLKAEADESA